MPVWLTYSLLAVCLGGLGFGLWVGGRAGSRRFARLHRYSGALQLVAALLAYVVLRPGAGDDGRLAIDEAKAAQQPIFVDLYSNF